MVTVQPVGCRLGTPRSCTAMARRLAPANGTSHSRAALTVRQERCLSRAEVDSFDLWWCIQR